jgi:hypothetical protein
VLDPEHGFAVTARRTYAEQEADSEQAYRAVYALVPKMWQEAGYYELALSDIWTLSKAEASAVPIRVALAHPSGRYMVPVAGKVLTRLFFTKIGLT